MAEVAPVAPTLQEDFQRIVRENIGDTPPDTIPVQDMSVFRESLQRQVFEQLGVRDINPLDLQMLLDQRPEVRQASLSGATSISQSAGPVEMHGARPNVDAVELLDIAGTRFLAGLIGGIVKPFENFPLLGPKIVRPYLSPIVERLNQEALLTAMEAIGETPGADLPKLASIIGTTAGLLGSMTGLIIPFTGVIKAARLLFTARAVPGAVAQALGATGARPIVAAGAFAGRTAESFAASPTGLILPRYMADMTGFFAYGALSKEPSLIQSLISGGHGGASQHSDDFWGDIQERAGAGVFSALELGALDIAFTTLAQSIKILRNEGALVRQLRAKVSITDDDLVRLYTPTDPQTGQRVLQTKGLLDGVDYSNTMDAQGSILVNLMRSGDEAAETARLEIQDMVIQGSPAAVKAVINGAQRGESLAQALIDMPQGRGSFVMGTRVGDLEGLVRETQAGLARRAEAAAEVVTPGLSHTADELTVISASNPLTGFHVGYGQGNGLRTALRGNPTDAAATEDLIEFVLKASTPSKVKRVATWDELLKVEPVKIAAGAERVKNAAIKTETGQIFEAPIHILAIEEASEAGAIRGTRGFESGFTTTRGRFVSAEEAEALNLGLRELERLEDVVIPVGGRPRRKTQAAAREQTKDLNRVLRGLAKNNEILVVEEGAHVFALQESAIKSAKGVTPEALAQGRSLPANAFEGIPKPGVPLAVALNQRFPDMEFLVRQSANEPGLKDFLGFWKDVRPTDDVIRQFEEGVQYIPGQLVQHVDQRTMTFLGFAGKTEAKVRLDSGKVTRVKLDSLQPGMFGLPVNFDPGNALARDFVGFAIREMDAVAARQPGRAGFKETIKGIEGVGNLKRETRRTGSEIIDEEELGAEFAARRRAEGESLERGIKTNDKDTHFTEPVPIQNEFDAVFSRWMQSRGLSFTTAEAEATKLFMTRALRESLHKQIPVKVRELAERQFAETGRLIEEAVAANPLEGMAAAKGFTITRLPSGAGLPPRIQIERLLTRQQKIFIDEEAALRYVTEANAVTENLHKGLQFLDVPMPGQINGLVRGFSGDDLINANSPTIVGQLAELYAGGIGIPSNQFMGMQRWFSLASEKTGMPLDELFARYISGRKLAQNAAAPFKKEITAAAGKMSRAERIQISEFMRSIENKADWVNEATRVAAAREFGLAENQIAAMERLQKVKNGLFIEETRLTGQNFDDDYLWNYITRIAPLVEKSGETTLSFNTFYAAVGQRTAQKDLWFRYSRTGEMAQIELDPFLAMQKYTNALFHERHVMPAWEEMNRLTQMKFGDLPKSARKELRGLFPTEELRRKQPAIQDDIRKPMIEWLAFARGNPQEGADGLVRFLRDIYERNGIKISEAAIKESVSMQLASVHGAAMAGRIRPIVRNGIQDLWNLLPRVDVSAFARGFEKAITETGIAEARAGRAFSSGQGFVEGGELLFQARIDIDQVRAIADAGFFAPLKASMLRGALRAGRFSQKVAEFGLKPFQASDSWNRILAYHVQVEHVRPYLARLNAKTMTEEGFRRRGLFAWGKAEQDTFLRILGRQGDTEALRYIGEQGANLTNYLYALSASPAAFQSSFGRVMGMFGTWPIYQKDLLLTNLKNTDTVGKMMMATKYAGVTASVVGMGYAWGANLLSWMGPLAPFGYAGGPQTDVMVSLKQAIESPWAHKPAAFARAGAEQASLIIPGQILFHDIRAIAEAKAATGDPKASFSAAFFGRPSDRGVPLFQHSEKMADEQMLNAPRGIVPTTPLPQEIIPLPIPPQ